MDLMFHNNNELNKFAGIAVVSRNIYAYYSNYSLILLLVSVVLSLKFGQKCYTCSTKFLVLEKPEKA